MFTSTTIPSSRTNTTRAGGIAGLLVPVACAVAVYSTAVDGPNLRQGAFPWAVSAGCVLAALTVAALARRHVQVWGRARRAVARTTTAGLAGVAGFFVLLGGEDLLNRTVGTARVLSGSDLLTGLGTLAASLLAVVVVPAGLLLVGVFVAGAGVLGRPGRAAMLAVGPGLVLGAALTGATATPLVFVTWPLLLGACWAVVGTALLREGSVR
jgi:hypothetical protein